MTVARVAAAIDTLAVDATEGRVSMALPSVVLGHEGRWLMKHLGQLPQFVGNRFAFVENVIHGIQNGHFYLQLFVDFGNALGAVVAFGNHLHLGLCGLYRVSFANHGAEKEVAAEP